MSLISREVIMRKYMKYSMLTMLLSSIGSFANSHELIIEGEPVTVTLVGGGEASLSSCSDLIELKKSGKIIIDVSKPVPRLEWEAAKDKLFECWLNAYASTNGMAVSHPDQKPTTEEVVKHFPATAGLILSHSAEEKAKNQFSGKTISDWSPGLKPDSDKHMVSADEGYVVTDYVVLKNAAGKTQEIIYLGAYVTQGTAGSHIPYRIDSKKTTPWKITMLTINNPL